MYNDLKHGEIDGILMERYQALHSLYAINETRFKVFDSFQVEIPYYIVMPESRLSQLLADPESCFKMQIDNQDIDSLLIRYLKPIQVTMVTVVWQRACKVLHNLSSSGSWSNEKYYHHNGSLPKKTNRRAHESKDGRTD